MHHEFAETDIYRHTGSHCDCGTDHSLFHADLHIHAHRDDERNRFVHPQSDSHQCSYGHRDRSANHSPFHADVHVHADGNDERHPFAHPQSDSHQCLHAHRDRQSHRNPIWHSDGNVQRVGDRDSNDFGNRDVNAKPNIVFPHLRAGRVPGRQRPSHNGVLG